MSASLITLCLGVVIPLYVLARLRTGELASKLLNFTLYPLVFCYFYVLLPVMVQIAAPQSLVAALQTSETGQVEALSTWIAFVFFFCYLSSRDNEYRPNTLLRIAPTTLLAARAIQVGAVAVTVFVLLRHWGELYRAAGDRASSYSVYSDLLDTYKLQLVFTLDAVASVFVFLHHKTKRSFTALAPFCVLDALTGGRGYLFATIFIVYLCHVTFNFRGARRATVVVAVGTLVLFVSAFLRRYAFDSEVDPLFSLFGEFYGGRWISGYAIDYFSNSSQLSTYWALVSARLLPQFLVAPLFDPSDLANYAVVINASTGISYGLAGSLIAEAVYYGGIGYAFFAPVLVAAVYWIMNRTKIVASVPGYLFFLLLTASTYNIFRSSFFMIWAALIYMFTFYISPLILTNWKKTVLRPASSDRLTMRVGVA